jgi:hypothetical protein
MNTIIFLCGLLKTWRPHSFTHDNLVKVQALLSNDDIIVHFECLSQFFSGQEYAAFSFSVEQLRVPNEMLLLLAFVERNSGRLGFLMSLVFVTQK